MAAWHHAGATATILITCFMTMGIEHAPGDVVGGTLFVLLFWVAGPAAYLVPATVYRSALSRDHGLLALSSLPVVLVAAALTSAPPWLLRSLGLTYVGLVALYGAWSWYRRRSA